MKFIHTKCGGTINTETRTCEGCKKHWNPISFLLTPGGIRQVPGSQPTRATAKALREKKHRGKTTYAKWGDRIPGVAAVASHLPSWPRWIRILTALVFVGIVIGIILLVVK